MTQSQGLSRPWNFSPSIPGLSRIFKDRGNPDDHRNFKHLGWLQRFRFAELRKFFGQQELFY